MSKVSKMVADDLMMNGIDYMDLFNASNWYKDICNYIQQKEMFINIEKITFTLIVEVNGKELYNGDLKDEYANKIVVGFGALRYANCFIEELATEEHFKIYAYDENNENDNEIIILIKF